MGASNEWPSAFTSQTSRPSKAFGTLGLHVGSRTDSDRRTQDGKEWWVVRRFLKAALLANVLPTPLAIWKEQPPMPDFGAEFGDAQSPAFIEITEATHPDDQREMTELLERSGKSAMLLGELGGRFSGGASEPEYVWASDIVDAMKRKAGKSIYSLDAYNRHLVINPNSNASILIADEEHERRAFTILAQTLEPRMTEYIGITSRCAIHVLGKHFVCIDLLGSTRLIARAASEGLSVCGEFFILPPYPAPLAPMPWPPPAPIRG